MHYVKPKCMVLKCNQHNFLNISLKKSCTKECLYTVNKEYLNMGLFLF